MSNQELDLHRHGGKVSHGRLRPDLLWPGHGLVIEVNGRAHDSHEAADEDARRVSDYQALGLTVFVVRGRTISLDAELDRLIVNVATALDGGDGRSQVHKVRRIMRSKGYPAARNLLRRLV